MARRPSRVANAASQREAVRDTASVPTGKSILELAWDELDAVMEILMAPGDFDLEEALDWYKGRANGLATCIALMHNPYVPDVVAVRELAKERYRQLEAGEPVEPLVTRPPTRSSDL